jgi:hypothetical protein
MHFDPKVIAICSLLAILPISTSWAQAQVSVLNETFAEHPLAKITVTKPSVGKTVIVVRPNQNFQNMTLGELIRTGQLKLAVQPTVVTTTHVTNKTVISNNTSKPKNCTAAAVNSTAMPKAFVAFPTHDAVGFLPCPDGSHGEIFATKGHIPITICTSHHSSTSSSFTASHSSASTSEHEHYGHSSGEHSGDSNSGGSSGFNSGTYS